MLYIKLFIEREKNTGQSAPECPFKDPSTHKRLKNLAQSGSEFRPPKGTSLRDFTSFELSRVKIHPRFTEPVCVPEKKGINKKILLCFTHLPRSPQWVDLYQIWYRVPLVDVISYADFFVD